MIGVTDSLPESLAVAVAGPGVKMVGNGGRWVQLALMVPMAILGSPVSLRKPPTGATVCLDYAPASNVNPVITTACVPGQASQQLGFDPRTGYIHEEGVSPAPSCREGPPCCIENFFGGIVTVWGCSDPSGKTFTYSNVTGLIESIQGFCLAYSGVGAKVDTDACDATNPNQVWNMEAAADPPGPPGDTCANLGCNITWRPSLKCQCNANCCTYKNCCPDFKTKCGGCEPAPPPPPPSPPPPPGFTCPRMSGHWSVNGAEGAQITQDRCSLEVSVVGRPAGFTASGKFSSEWSPALTITGTQEVWTGRLVGCNATDCPAGSRVTWNSSIATTWTKISS